MIGLNLKFFWDPPWQVWNARRLVVKVQFPACPATKEAPERGAVSFDGCSEVKQKTTDKSEFVLSYFKNTTDAGVVHQGDDPKKPTTTPSRL